MKTLSIILALVIAGFGSAFAAETKWDFDNSHTEVGFEVSHMVIATTSGNFKDFSGTVQSNGNNFENAKIEFTVDINSIDTDNEKRDNHLKSDDFFDAKNHPKMTFKSTSMKAAGKNKYKLTGNLTIRGVTKKVTLDVKLNGTVKDPWGNERAGFKLTGTVNRFDYGLKWNTALETGGLVVSEDVDIIANVELIKKK